MDHAPDSIRVLHVDDDPNFAEITAEFLERVDDRFEVVTETNGSDGLARLMDGEFDGVVSDYEMPGMTGLEFLKSVRDVFPDLPFILFTGKGSEDIAAEAISAGVTDYIQKQGGTDQYTLLANRLLNAVEYFYAVRQIELRQRAMETANEGLSLVKPDGTFSYVNPAFGELFGYSPDELVGKHWSVLYHNEEARRLERDILPAVLEVGYWAGETVRLTKQDERLVTDHRLASTAEDVIVCTATDVTDERTSMEVTGTGLEFLAEVLEDHVFFALDHEGYVTWWNSDAEQLVGYPAEGIVGSHLSTFFTDEDRRTGLPEELIETAAAEGSVSSEGWRVRQDGSRFWADMMLSASFDEAGTLRGFGNIFQESTQHLVNA